MGFWGVRGGPGLGGWGDNIGWLVGVPDMLGGVGRRWGCIGPSQAGLGPGGVK